jgi:hypothetical protein
MEAGVISSCPVFNMNKISISLVLFSGIALSLQLSAQEMDDLWGYSTIKLRAEKANCHKVAVSCIEGNIENGKLKSIRVVPID